MKHSRFQHVNESERRKDLRQLKGLVVLIALPVLVNNDASDFDDCAPWVRYHQIVAADQPGEAALKSYETVRSDCLKALPHSGGAVELKHKAPEVTFLGVNDQPDFATLFVTMYPHRCVIELKSLKEYLYQWRNIVVSYERFLDVVYEHLMSVYEPVRLRLTLQTRPRGGISSKLTIDSDWSIRGGKEQFRDWVGMEDSW